MNEQDRYNLARSPELENWRTTQVKKSETDNKATSAFVMDVDNNDLENLNNVQTQHRVRLNGVESECLYDSGATCCVVKRNLIDESALTGKKTLCTLIDGSVKQFPTANVVIEGEYFTGQIEALVMENPVKPVIIGRVNGLIYQLRKNKDWNKSILNDYGKNDELKKTP